jgi:hypothetical protein
MAALVAAVRLPSAWPIAARCGHFASCHTTIGKFQLCMLATMFMIFVLVNALFYLGLNEPFVRLVIRMRGMTEMAAHAVARSVYEGASLLATR